MKRAWDYELVLLEEGPRVFDATLEENFSFARLDVFCQELAER